MKDLNRKMATGAVWMSALRMSIRLIGLLSTAILARLLVPGDFGLVAMATSVVAFLELATAFNFDVPLIQKQSASRQHFDTAWTLNIIFYSGISALLLILAEPAAAFYQEERLTEVLYVLAGGFFIGAFSNIGIVEFRKQLNFRKEFMLLLLRKGISVLITIPLAFYLRSYWALIIGIVCGNLASVILTYIVHPYRPRLSLAASRELMGFSSWLVVNNILGFFRLRIADILIGRISGPTALGYFSVSFEISTLATTEIVAPINRAVFPGFSQIAGDTPELRKSYINVLSVVALLALPASLGISAIANPLVLAFFGDQWTSAVPLVSLLAVFGGLGALQTNIVYIFNARGKPQVNTVLGFVNVAVLLVICVPLAIRYGSLGMAYGYVAAYALSAPLNFEFVRRELAARWVNILGVLLRPALASAAMYFALKYFESQWVASSSPNEFVQLVVLIPTGALIYASVLCAIWILQGRPASTEYHLLRLGVRKLSSLRATPAEEAKP